MDQPHRQPIDHQLSSSSNQELLALWRSNDPAWQGEAGEAIARAAAARGLPLPDRKRFKSASAGDVVISIFTPPFGLLIGLVVAARGEHRRGLSMVIISVVVFALAFIVLINADGT